MRSALRSGGCFPVGPPRPESGFSSDIPIRNRRDRKEQKPLQPVKMFDTLFRAKFVSSCVSTRSITLEIGISSKFPFDLASGTGLARGFTDNPKGNKGLETQYTILIADRNSHVREFLRRELTEAGFRVLQAEKGRDVIDLVYHCESLMLVVVDPDLPDMEETVLLKKIGDRIPALPVVIHAFQSDGIDYFRYLKNLDFVEKGGRSIEKLKQVVLEKYSARKAKLSKNMA
jgi:CheY-like chemotaxis protein